MPGAILEVDGLVKSFGETDVLRGVSFAVGKGEFLTLLGPSGCGKTTTLRIVAGLARPDSGRVLLDGEDVTGFAPERRRVNTVFQNYALFPHMNVQKNIEYGLLMRGVKRAERAARAKELLRVVQLEGFERRMPDELSGGQRQRVAIARAAAPGADALLLDEPLGALDLKLRREMQVELKSLQARLKIAFIYITHDQEEALNMSDRIAIMNAGRIEQFGSPEDIYERPRTRFAARFIGEGALFEGVLESATSGGECRVRLGCGACLATASAPVNAGARVAVSVHAERIVASESAVAGFDMPAAVLSRRYAGSALRTELEFTNGERVTALSAVAPAPGERVYVSWLPSHGALIAEEDAK